MAAEAKPAGGGLSEEMLRIIRGEVAPEQKHQQYEDSLKRCVSEGRHEAGRRGAWTAGPGPGPGPAVGTVPGRGMSGWSGGHWVVLLEQYEDSLKRCVVSVAEGGTGPGLGMAGWRGAHGNRWC